MLRPTYFVSRHDACLVAVPPVRRRRRRQQQQQGLRSARWHGMAGNVARRVISVFMTAQHAERGAARSSRTAGTPFRIRLPSRREADRWLATLRAAVEAAHDSDREGLFAAAPSTAADAAATPGTRSEMQVLLGRAAVLIESPWLQLTSECQRC
eukprot:COSAG01_NODE_18646_length_1062_cov_1.984496_1_plen_154_part_00